MGTLHAQGTAMRAILSYSHRCAHVTESILIFCARRLPITAMELTVGKGFVWMTSILFAASVILDIREYDAWISSQIILPLALRYIAVGVIAGVIALGIAVIALYSVKYCIQNQKNKMEHLNDNHFSKK